METEFIKKMICNDLYKLGVNTGDTLLVHSSLKSLGPVPGKAETVISALLEVLGNNGTLLFPALSFSSVNAASPYFDQHKTPCCVGGLAEYFRTRPGTVRSIHPTHSMSGVGKNAGFLLNNHHLDTTSCGENSPFRKLKDIPGSKILFIGCGIAPNTSMHAVEELFNPPYLHGAPLTYRITTADGKTNSMTVRRHNFAGYAQTYARMAYLLSPAELRYGNILCAFCALMDVQAMWQKGCEALKKDPFYFVRPLKPQGDIHPRFVTLAR